MKKTMTSIETKAIVSMYPPPIWDKIKVWFPHASLEEQIFAYADTIYWSKQDVYPLSADLMAHETTHLAQQAFSVAGANMWWEKYASDPEFRVKMELEACRAQYQCALRMTNDRTKLFNLRQNLAKNLSSDVYNNCISFADAYKQINA